MRTTNSMFLKKNIWAIVFIALIIAFAFNKIGLLLSPYAGYLLMLLMFFSCIDVGLEDIRTQSRRWKTNLLLLAIIHLLSPLLVLLFKPFFSEQIFLGLIIASAISSGMSVVFLSCLYCEGIRESLFRHAILLFRPVDNNPASSSLVITSVSNIISPLVVPLVVLVLAQQMIFIDYIAIGILLFKFVIIPLLAAMVVRTIRGQKIVKKIGGHFSIYLLLLILIGVIAPVRDVFLKNLNLSFLLLAICILLTIINFSVGYLLGNSKKESITYGITASYKNFTLASVVALSLFNPVVALPAIVYAIANNLLLIPLQYITKQK